MWHKPQLLTAIADLLLLVGVAVVVAGGLLWASRLPLFPLREVVITEPLRETRRPEIERALNGLLRGNFFSVRPEQVRQALEQLPWVRRAEVRRQWPGRLEIRIEEHQAVARWGEGLAQLVNSHGEVFYGATKTLPKAVLFGPTGSAPEVLQRYRDFARVLAPTGRAPQQVTLSPRLAWRIRLDDGMAIELGREQTKAPLLARLERFVEAYGEAVAARPTRPAEADLRYPNGFALRLAGLNAPAGGAELRGNP